MRRSKTCCPESCDAVREAAGDRDHDRPAPPAVDSAGVSHGAIVAGGVLPAATGSLAPGSARDRCVAGDRRQADAVGLLEVYRPTAQPGRMVEPQARASRLLCAAPQPAAPHASTTAASHPASARRTAGAESDLGDRLHV